MQHSADPHRAFRRLCGTPPGPLERKPQRQLPNASIYRRADDDAERGRCEIGVRVRKLGMVQCVVKLYPKLQLALLNGPVQIHGF